jgi:hypothetical protein
MAFLPSAAMATHTLFRPSFVLQARPSLSDMDICDSEQLNALARMMPDPCQVLMSSVEWAVDGLKGIEPIGRKHANGATMESQPTLHGSTKPALP